MSWLGKVFTVTTEHMRAPWSGFRDGRWFRCYLCGRFFEEGDAARSVYSNFSGSPFQGNPFVCDSRCGAGTNEEVLAELGRQKAALPWWAAPWGIEPPGRPSTATPTDPAGRATTDETKEDADATKR